MGKQAMGTSDGQCMRSAACVCVCAWELPVTCVLHPLNVNHLILTTLPGIQRDPLPGALGHTYCSTHPNLPLTKHPNPAFLLLFLLQACM